MRRYETIIILRPNTGEDGINKVIDYTKEIIAAENGVIIELNKWGQKKLAYPIKKENLGYYVFFDFAGEPAAIAEIERRFRIDDSVIKYLTVKTADDIDTSEAQEATTAAEKRLAEEAERAQAEREEQEKAAEEQTEEKPAETAEQNNEQE